jgi:hypothetical protein
MVKKLESCKTLTGRKKAAKDNPKITALQVELAHVDNKIEKAPARQNLRLFRPASCCLSRTRQLRPMRFEVHSAQSVT